MTTSIRAIVTGHSSGIGRAVADALRARGIAVLGLSRRALGKSAAGEGAGQAALAALVEHAIDLSRTQVLQVWLDTPALADFLGGAQQVLLINNAGTAEPVAACGRQGAQAIADAVTLNVAAPLLLTDAFIAASADVADRRVLHISSGAALKPYAGWSIYCATKAALDMHARAVREDAVPRLKIAALAPGVVDTAMQATIRAADPEDFPQRPRFEALKADGALTSPQEVARKMVAWMLSAQFASEAVADLRTMQIAAD